MFSWLEFILGPVHRVQFEQISNVLRFLLYEYKFRQVFRHSQPLAGPDWLWTLWVNAADCVQWSSLSCYVVSHFMFNCIFFPPFFLFYLQSMQLSCQLLNKQLKKIAFSRFSLGLNRFMPPGKNSALVSEKQICVSRTPYGHDDTPCLLICPCLLFLSVS